MWSKFGQPEGGGLVDSSGPGLPSQPDLFLEISFPCLETECHLPPDRAGLHSRVYIQHLAEFLAHIKCSVNISRVSN